MPNKQQQGQPLSGGNDDYKRDEIHMGSGPSSSQKVNVPRSQSGGGGASGYDPNEEQKEVNKEREKMHDERNPEEFDVEKPHTPKPEIDPERIPQRETPEPAPETEPNPERKTDPGSANWSQSSWDLNNMR